MTSAIGMCYDYQKSKMKYTKEDAFELACRLNAYAFCCDTCGDWHISKINKKVSK